MSVVLNIACEKQVGKLFSVLAGIEVSDLPLTRLYRELLEVLKSSVSFIPEQMKSFSTTSLIRNLKKGTLSAVYSRPSRERGLTDSFN